MHLAWEAKGKPLNFQKVAGGHKACDVTEQRGFFCKAVFDPGSDDLLTKRILLHLGAKGSMQRKARSGPGIGYWSHKPQK